MHYAEIASMALGGVRVERGRSGYRSLDVTASSA